MGVNFSLTRQHRGPAARPVGNTLARLQSFGLSASLAQRSSVECLAFALLGSMVQDSLKGYLGVRALWALTKVAEL
jgi:hypothetical protein